jgi:hypothetical protein
MYISRHKERILYHQLRPIWPRLHHEYALNLLTKTSRFLYRTADDGARGIVEMLFCTSLIALVGAADQPQSSPRKLQIVNTKVGKLLFLETSCS